ncbi:hypothetical protein ACRALDRAFT_1063606 [Sodiomyces alcalophilus JCM 7366]|uniref:uncharacterized protein n=1 Tax=Sodiomyces alcalophilus JCM 7366 TaxID=591952 RepID=UPI0039B3F54A
MRPAYTRSQRTLTSTMAARPFSTQARVYPAFLPYLHTQRRLAAKWIPPTIALIAAAYAVNYYVQLETTSRRAAALAEHERQARESRALTIELLDAYGDGSSLEALEKAVEVYEARTAASTSRREASD